MKVNWNPTTPEARRFGTLWMSAMTILATILYFRHHIMAAYCLWGMSISVGILSWVSPFLARLFYRAWMGLSAGIAAVISRLVLSILFWGVVTPVALFFKILRRDALHLKKSNAESYWQTHAKIDASSDYRHLF